MKFKTLFLPIVVTALTYSANTMAFSNTILVQRPLVQHALVHIKNHSNSVKKSPYDQFFAQDIIIDKNGSEHVRFNRTYKGLSVVGGDTVVHSNKKGNFKSASHTLKHIIDLNTQPHVNKAIAIKLAEQNFGHSGIQSGPTFAKLVVYSHGTPPTLAWDVKVTGKKNDGTPAEDHYIVDATFPKSIDHWQGIETGIPSVGVGNSFFNGTVSLATDFANTTSQSYYLRDTSRGNQYTLNMNNKQSGGSTFTDTDNTWGNSTLSNTQTIAVDAQYGTAVTWDYYLNIHGRNGIANDGKGAYNRVHYGNKYNNAFWSDACFCMTYGDGDGVNFNPFDSLDVAGHEMSHGLTSRTANLIYSGESGGLNEATSDIFGTMVEYYANNPSDPGDYNIGEKLYKNGLKSIRYMHNPSKDGISSDCWYSDLKSLDVHYSSGVANHFYYLLAEGSSPNTSPSSPSCLTTDTKKANGGIGSLIGIGRNKAEKIWYRALTIYMTSSTNYADARAATLNAAADLYGIGSPEQNAVAAAWYAVNVN